MWYVIIGSWVALSIVAGGLYAWLRHERCKVLKELREYAHAETSVNVFISLTKVTDLLEALYTRMDEIGTFEPTVRHVVAENISIARSIVAEHVGPPPFIDRTHRPGSTWPFNAEGKVQP